MPGPRLFISEVFGPTFQGEGRNLGMPCMFLRLGGCNLACTWCDTPYTWDWKRFDPRREVTAYSIDDVYQRLAQSPIKNLVISGGEPMLQEKAMVPLCRALRQQGWWIEMETAGTVAPRHGAEVCLYTVSPKLAHSGNLLAQRLRREVLVAFRDSGRAVWKFVVERPDDFAEIDALVGELGLEPVYVMPQAADSEALVCGLGTLAQATVERGYHLTTRLHVTVYGTRRGV